MSYSAEKEQKTKQMQVQLNQLTISAVTKSQLKERFAKVSKVSHLFLSWYVTQS